MMYLKTKFKRLVSGCPSISVSGSVKGMKKMYWGENAEVVRCGSYYYKINDSGKYHQIKLHTQK